MAGVKISQLPAVASALLTDFFPVVQAGVTSQETLSQVSTLFQTIMLPLAGGTMAGAINMGSNAINSLLDPVNPQDAATKNYVDTIAVGGGAPVFAASTTALTVTYNNGVSGVGATLTNAGAQATFALDGQSPSVGQRVLIKNQASNVQNGVYTVTNVGSGATNWVLTRATDYDTPTDINNTGIIPVESGTVNANTGWVNTTLMVTIGTTAVTFVQFGATYPLSMANGGTGANLTPSAGAIPYSGASAMALLAATATAGLALLSGSNAAPTWSNLPPITKINVQTFIATGSSPYTASAGLVFAKVQVQAGGAGGGGAVATSAGQNCIASAGGGGAYSEGIITAATIGASQTVTVGASAAGGANTGGNGTAGNSSSFGSLIVCGGGAAGTGNASASGGFINAGGAGGTVSTAGNLFSQSGQTGSSGYGVSGSGFSAKGGDAFLGHGAAIVGGNASGAYTNSVNGQNYGGGGGGGLSTDGGGATPGGSGAQGIVIVTEFISS